MKRASQPHSNSQQKKSGHVRIISGQWRGRKLPVANVEGLRPTTDRNKETLFNWLMHDIQNAQCLDAFAGSGGLGIEALSRYAAHCLFLEKDKKVANQLSTNLQKLEAKSEVRQGDTLDLLKTINSTFDIIFLDPPFHKGLAAPALSLIIDNQLLKPGGVIYLEQEASLPIPELPENFVLSKEKRLTQLNYFLISNDN